MYVCKCVGVCCGCCITCAQWSLQLEKLDRIVEGLESRTERPRSGCGEDGDAGAGGAGAGGGAAVATRTECSECMLLLARTCLLLRRATLLVSKQ